MGGNPARRTLVARLRRSGRGVDWQLGRIDDLDHPGGPSPGQTSFDQLAGPLGKMFDFDDGPHPERVILDRLTGEVTGDR